MSEEVKPHKEGLLVYKALPPSQVSTFLNEGEKNLKQIKEGLDWSLAVKDLHRGASFYIRALDRFISFYSGSKIMVFFFKKKIFIP